MKKAKTEEKMTRFSTMKSSFFEKELRVLNFYPLSIQ